MRRDNKEEGEILKWARPPQKQLGLGIRVFGDGRLETSTQWEWTGRSLLSISTGAPAGVMYTKYVYFYFMVNNTLSRLRIIF